MTKQALPVDALELRLAFDFVSSGAPFEHNAYICLKTGKIYYHSSFGDDFEEEGLPDDLETSDQYLALPRPEDIGLGRRLAVNFAERALKGDCEKVAAIFRKRGAYARFKELLSARSKLEEWYEFEERASAAALQIWCDEKGLRLVDDLRDTAH